MATTEIHIDDEKLLDFLRSERKLQEGETHNIAVSVEAQAPTSNSSISHVVTVELRYGLDLGQLQRLAGF